MKHLWNLKEMKNCFVLPQVLLRSKSRYTFDTSLIPYGNYILKYTIEVCIYFLLNISIKHLT